MEKIFGYIDQNLNRFIDELFVLLRQPSISARWEGVVECSQLLTGIMEKIGIKPRILPMGGKHSPPLIYGEILNPEARRTLLIYGHFDVQPPEPLDAWDSPLSNRPSAMGGFTAGAAPIIKVSFSPISRPLNRC